MTAGDGGMKHGGQHVAENGIARTVADVAPMLARRADDPIGALAAAGDSATEGAAPGLASLSLLARLKWSIMGVFLALSAVSVPLIWWLTAPVYRASAAVRVSPVVPRIVFSTEENVNLIGSFYTIFVNTQVAEIGSTPVMLRVLERPDVRQTTWYRHAPATLKTPLGAAPPTPLERLRKDLQARPQPGTELIEVSMTGESSRDATIVVNAVVEEYKKCSDHTFKETDRLRLDALERERSQRQSEINSLLEMRGKLSELLGVDNPEELRTHIATRLKELEGEEEKLRREHEIAMWELQSYRPSQPGAAAEGADPNERASTAAHEIDFTQDSEWHHWETTLRDLQNKLAVAGRRFGEEHPEIQDLQRQVAQAQERLQDRQSWLEGRAPETAMAAGPGNAEGMIFMNRSTLEHHAERKKRELELLEQDIVRQRARVSEASELARSLVKYDEELKQAREMYAAVRDRLDKLEMESKAQGRISIAAQAIETSQPYDDPRKSLTAVALAGSLMVGLAVAYLRTMVNPRIVGAGDVRYTMHVPFLGEMPALSASAGKKLEQEPLAAEYMRMIRTAVLERLGSTARRVVLITSASGRAGKTSVSLGLARSLACLGKRTLLVEADLRRPALAQRLGIRARLGLAALLSGRTGDSAVILHGDMDKLDVIVAGDLPAEFSFEMLANGVFSACLSRWSKTYDFVLLDSPPVLPVADARILAGQANGTIFVLRSSHCRRGEVAQAYAELSAAGGALLGTVLVGVESGSRSGFEYSYESEGEQRSWSERDSEHQAALPQDSATFREG